MDRVGVLILVWCLTIAALVRPAAAGEFPKNLAFLKGLPVVIAGECLYDSDGVGTERFGPCEVRASRDASGGYLFYILETTAAEQLDVVQSFTLSTREVAPPQHPPGKWTVVTRGTCSGQELGLRGKTPCEIVVFPNPAAGERIFLRLIRSPAPLNDEFFEVRRGVIIPAERPPRAPVRERGGDDVLARGSVPAR